MMMDTKQYDTCVGLWEKIELVSEEDPHGAIYQSRVEDITSDGIIISIPVYGGGDGQLLTSHSLVNVRFKRPDAMYQFSARMKGIKNNFGKRILLYDLGRLVRVQRREFVRLNYRMSLEYAKLTGDNWAEDALEWKSSETIDISAGGFLMRVDDTVQPHDRLLLNVDRAHRMGLPRLVVALCCRVVRVDHNHMAGVAFIRSGDFAKYFSHEQIELIPEPARQFDTAAQNKMIKFVFDEQVQKRQMGKL